MPATNDAPRLHGDIKLDNMLLKKGPSGSRYDFIAKIADFGHSHFRSVDTEEQDKRGLDRHGNQEYCMHPENLHLLRRVHPANFFSPGAPEASHHTKFLRSGPNRVDFTADIFSLGAVTSEIATWVASNWDGIHEYFAIRKEATGRNNSFKGSGYGGCFHDGVDPLPEVGNQHKKIRKNLPDFDHITRKMIDLVDEGMLLVPAQNRWQASTLENKFEIYYQEAMDKMLRPPLLVAPVAREPGSPSAPTSSRTATPWESVNGHDRHLSTASESSAMSPGSRFSGLSLATPSSRPETISRPMSGDTFDGVSCPNGDVRCLPFCEPDCFHASQVTPSFTTADSPIDGDDTSRSNLTIPVPNESVAAHQHLTIPNQNGQPSARTSSSSARLKPSLTLEELGIYYKLRKERLAIPNPLKEHIELLETYIRNRDHIFYIDDSDTMEGFKADISKAFKWFSYLAKKVDKDGIEIVFGSDPTSIRRSGRTKPLINKLNANPFKEPTDKMEGNFDKFIKDILIPRLDRCPTRDISILVFTDGRWGDSLDAAAGVETPVKHLMQQLILKDIGRTRIMLSFVRFGDDTTGKTHLDYLDNCGKEPVFPDRRRSMKTW